MVGKKILVDIIKTRYNGIQLITDWLSLFYAITVKDV
jgi:hypothetical protein